MAKQTARDDQCSPEASLIATSCILSRSGSKELKSGKAVAWGLGPGVDRSLNCHAVRVSKTSCLAPAPRRDERAQKDSSASASPPRSLRARSLPLLSLNIPLATRGNFHFHPAEPKWLPRPRRRSCPMWVSRFRTTARPRLRGRGRRHPLELLSSAKPSRRPRRAGGGSPERWRPSALATRGSGASSMSSTLSSLSRRWPTIRLRLWLPPRPALPKLWGRLALSRPLVVSVVRSVVRRPPPRRCD